MSSLKLTPLTDMYLDNSSDFILYSKPKPTVLNKGQITDEKTWKENVLITLALYFD